MKWISLGSHCYPAWLIKSVGLRDAAYPFDWLFSDPQMVLESLEDEFVTFLNRSKHKFQSENKSTHTGYGPRFRHGTIFNHHDITKDETYSQFCRAVIRLFDALRSNERTCLVLMAPSARLSDGQFLRLSAKLRSFNRTNHLIAIRLQISGYDLGLIPEKDRSHQPEIRSSIDDVESCLYEFRPSSNMVNGMAFANESDNTILAKIIQDAQTNDHYLRHR